MNGFSRHFIPKSGRFRTEDKVGRREKLWWRGILAALALCVCLPGINRSNAAETSLPEYQVKALFLLNFTKYVDWPTNAFTEADSPFTIGICGENKFGDDLKKAVAGKSVNGHVISLRQVESAEDFRKCHVLFVAASEKKRVAEILGQVQSLPILTVGECEQFTEQGGAINFIRKGDSVRLEINLQAAQRLNLKISSKLLSVADVVKGKSK